MPDILVTPCFVDRKPNCAKPTSFGALVALSLLGFGCGSLDAGPIFLGRLPADADAGIPDRPAPDTGRPSQDAAVPSDAGPERPNLQVVLPELPTVGLAPGFQRTIDTLVMNPAGVRASATTVRISAVGADGISRLLAERSIPSMPARGSLVVSVTLDVPRATPIGRYEVKATVDPQDVVVESNEDDNDSIARPFLVDDVDLMPNPVTLRAPLGCVRRVRVEVHNRSEETLMFSPMGNDAVLAVEDSMIAAGSTETATMTLSFRPAAEGVFARTIILRDQRGFDHALDATLIAGNQSRRLESHLQVDRRRLDVLFVIDDSCSMGEEQLRLAENFGAFVDAVSQDGADFRVGVTTTDTSATGARGKLVGSPSIVTSTTPDPVLSFRTNALVGVSGSENETGLEATRLALESGITNPAFLRTDAALAIVWVSDEDDVSALPLAFYEEALRDLRSPSLLSTVALVGEAPAGCATAEPGLRYLSAAAALGGTSQSVCSPDLGQAVATLAGTDFGFQSEFPVLDPAEPSSIAVTVGGTLIPANDPNSGALLWRYDPDRQSIRFEPAAVPEASSLIEIAYLPVCGS